MMSVLVTVFLTFRTWLRSQAALQLSCSPCVTSFRCSSDHAPALDSLLRTASLGLALACLDRVASGAHHRQAGNGLGVASSRLPLVLDVEEPSSPGSTARVTRRPPAHSGDVASEPAVGRASNSR